MGFFVFVWNTVIVLFYFFAFQHHVWAQRAFPPQTSVADLTNFLGKAAHQCPRFWMEMLSKHMGGT